MVYKRDNMLLITPIYQSKEWEYLDIKSIKLIESPIGQRIVAVHDGVVYLGDAVESDKKIYIFRFLSKNYLKNKDFLDLFLNYKINVYISFDMYETCLKAGEKR